jgi:periplasmic divalent cation tolerance protein
MKQTGKIVILVTTGTETEAHKIAELLLTKRKAACVNIVPSVDSSFWWQGKLDSARESLLIIKTRASLLPEIIELVKSVHSYEVPEIIALPIIGGSEDYLKWIDDELKRAEQFVRMLRYEALSVGLLCCGRRLRLYHATARATSRLPRRRLPSASLSQWMPR